MNAEPEMPRRAFLKRTAAFALGAPYVIPASALGAEERPAPSNRIVMGCIGLGSQGSGNMSAFLRNTDVQVVAVCDVDSARREKARQKVDEHYAETVRSGIYKGCAEYKDFRELIARHDIEALSIALPDHWHAIPVIEGCKAGKDIYAEKPLALTIAQGRAMSDAVRRFGRVFQTGSQQRSSPRFRFACELARNGRLGRLRTVEVGLPNGGRCPSQPETPVPQGFDYEMWLGPAPWAPYTEKRCHWNFRWILDYSGGQVSDWGAHHCDIAHWGMGTEHTGPVEVKGRGEFPKDGLWNAATNYRFECLYAHGVRMICTNAFQNGVRFIGDKGWVFVNREKIEAQPNSLLSSAIGPDEIHLYSSADHHRNFLDCVRTRGPTVAPIETAHRSVTVAHLGNIAMLLERKVRWNPGKERFAHDPEADRMLSRAMRSPWKL